jgi:hypothetical protein
MLSSAVGQRVIALRRIKFSLIPQMVGATSRIYLWISSLKVVCGASVTLV